MAKVYNTSANFTNISNTEFDGGLQIPNLTALASRAYLLEEASGTVMTDTGTDDVDGTRNASLTQVAGAVAGRFATKGDGTNYNIIPWSANFRNNFTWEFWIKPTATDIATNFTGIIGLWRGDLAARHMYLRILSGKLNITYSANGSSGTIVGTSATLIADTWYHVRITYGATNGMVVSINGFSSGTGAYIGDLHNSNLDYYLFFSNGDATSAFRGSIADVRFYDEVLPSTYTIPTDYYSAIGESLINDSGVLYSDSGDSLSFDNSTALETATNLTLEYQYADYESPQSWATASEVNTNAAWNGTWLTLAQFQALDDPTARVYRYLKTRITGLGSLTEFSIDLYALDITPPTDVSATANSALSGEGATYDLITTFTGGTEIGTSGYAGANLEIEIDGVSYFQQSDGSFDTDETFANLLLKGNEGERSIAYALGELAIPDRFRINAWDNVGNYNRGDWATFAEADLDNIIKSAGGNWNDDNLTDQADFTANVKKNVIGGLNWTGGYDPTGVVINTPTLSVVNNEDGTATATVSGSSTGTTNTIYLAKYGTSAWVADGSRLEDGDITLTLDNGSYWGYIKSTLGTSCAYSIVAIFRVTDGEDAEIVNLAEQVKDLLDGSSIAGTGAEISRNYIQHERLENIQNTEIWVQPNEHRIETLSRAKDDHEFDIDISVLKRCKTTAETDSLILLSEQIYEFLRRVNVEEYTITTVSLPTLFSPDELVERNLFAAVLTVTFKGVK